MGFSLKNVAKATVGGGILNLLSGGKSGGVANPYGPVDFASLFGQDLEAPGNAYDYSGAFQNLMNMINAPSSVEDVLGDVEGEEMQNLLGDVDITTRNAYGSMMSDMADRGLVGPGQSSDIALNALGQVEGMGARTRAGIHSNYAMARLRRLMEKERRAEQAQSGWLNLLGGMAENARTRNLNRMLGLSGQQTQAYGNAAQLKEASKTPSYWEDILRGFSQNFGSSLGKTTGSGLGYMAV